MVICFAYARNLSCSASSGQEIQSSGLSLNKLETHFASSVHVTGGAWRCQLCMSKAEINRAELTTLLGQL